MGSAVSRVAGIALAALAAAFVRSDCDVATRLARIPPAHYKGKVVWVTGASSGIGRALACALARRGAKLVISARREGALRALRDELLALGAASVVEVPVDLAAGDNAASKAAQVALQATDGRLDVLFNNAGVSMRCTAADLEVDGIRRLFELNGALRCVHPHLSVARRMRM